jgi:hypothetical protein
MPFIGERDVSKDTVIEHGAVIHGPTISGTNARSERAHTYAAVLSSATTVLGNACEFKLCAV